MGEWDETYWHFVIHPVTSKPTWALVINNTNTGIVSCIDKEYLTMLDLPSVELQKRIVSEEIEQCCAYAHSLDREIAKMKYCDLVDEMREGMTHNGRI